MKVKRLVSVLLAALLLIGMIPMNALALTTAEEDSGQVTLMLSTKFGGQLKGVNGNANIAATSSRSITASYNNISAGNIAKLFYAKEDDEGGEHILTAEEAKKNADVASSAFVAEQNSDGVMEADPGQTIYLGIKYGVANQKNAKGVYPGGAVFIKYDGTKLEPLDGLDNTKYANNIAVNRAATDINSNVGYGESNHGSLLAQYCGDLKINLSASRVGGGTTADSFLGITLQTDTKSLMIPTYTPWDLVIPMKVKAGVKGTANIEVVEAETIAGTPSTMMLATSEVDGTTNLTTKPINAKNDHALASKDVTVKIRSTDPDLELEDKTVASTATSIKVKLNEYATKGSGFSTASNWTFGGAGAGNATVKAVSEPDANGIVTLTLNDSTAFTAGALTVTAKAGALAKKADSSDTTADNTLSGITVVAAPAVPTITASDTETAEVVTVPANTWYKLGSGNWTKATDGTGTKLTAKQLTGVMTGTPTTSAGVETYTGVFQLAADAEGKIKTDVPLKKFAAPVVAAGTAIGSNDALVNFETEELTLASGVTATVDNANVTSSGKVTPGKKLVVTKAASGDTFGSKTEVTLPARGTHGALTASAADSDMAKTGKTTVGGLKPFDQFIKNNDGTNTPAATAFSTATTVGAGETSVDVAAVSGEFVWARTPGKNGATLSASSFATTPAKVEGTGWDYSTVALASDWTATEDGKTIKLTKTGPIAWATFSVSNFTLTDTTDGSAAPNITGLTTSTGELAISAPLTKGHSYSLVVKKEAITGGALNSKTGTDTTLTVDGPSDNAVSVTAKDQKGTAITLDTSKISANTASKEITATLPAGTEIKSVTSSDENKLTIVTGSYTDGADYDGNKFKVKVLGVTGKPEENPVALTITTSPIAVAFSPVSAGFELNDNADVKSFALQNDSKLTGVTYTIAPVGSAPADGLTYDGTAKALKTVNNKFTAKGDYQYTVTPSNGADAVTITVSVTGIAATPDFSGVTHKWDAKTTITETEMAGLKWTDKTGTTLTPTAYSKDVESSMNVLGGSDVGTQTVTLKKGTLTVGGTEYDVAGGTYNVTVTAADVASVAVGTAKAKPDTIANVAKAIGAAEVTATTDTGATVKAKLSDVVSEADIQAIITDKLTTAALPDAIEKAKKDFIEKYKQDNPSASDQDAEDAATAAATTIENTAKAAVAAELADAGYKVKSGTDVSFDLPYTKADGTQVTASTTAQLSDNVNAKDLSGESITVSANVKSSGGGSGGGTYVPSVELDTENFGTADGPVELDENNKITKLPGVTGIKLGVVFKGWATQEGNPNTIVKVGREITTDTTLHGIFEGYMSGDNNESGQRVARPNDSVSRAELVTMLVRAAGIYDASIDYTTSFGDAQGSWYTTYIGCAQTAGILTGDAEGTARPRDEITREEAAILIAKTFKVDVAIGGTTEYVTDFNKSSSWAKDYVAALVNNGTIIGYPVGDDYEFRGKNDITRAEVSAMINKYLGLAEAQKKALAADSSVKSPFTDVQNRESWYYTDMAFATLNVPANNYGTEVTYPTR